MAISTITKQQQKKKKEIQINARFQIQKQFIDLFECDILLLYKLNSKKIQNFKSTIAKTDWKFVKRWFIQCSIMLIQFSEMKKIIMCRHSHVYCI